MNLLIAGLRLSFETLTWSLRFYAGHFWVVFGLSMIPTAQRFVLVYWGEKLPAGVNLTAEVIAEGTRIVLVYTLVRLAVSGDPKLAPLDLKTRWKRFSEFTDHHRIAFFTQFAMLGAAFVVLDLIPNLAIAALVPPTDQTLATSILVSAKNPTVIALTFIWMVGLAKAMMLDSVERAGRPFAPGTNAAALSR